MNELEIFKYEEAEVRVIIDEAGNPWWVAKDVCTALGLVNVGEAVTKLDSDELTSEKMMSGGQFREMKIINESGLYALILRSNKPEAKKFKRWITHDVLPSIRKTGQYSLNAMTRLEMAKWLVTSEEKNLEQATKIALDQPKVEFFDAVADSKDAIEMSQVAKVLDMGIGRNGIFQILRDRGILRYNNEPYQTYIDSGHFRSVEQKWSKPDGSVHIAIKTLVYQKGVVLIKQTIGSAERLLGE